MKIEFILEKMPHIFLDCFYRLYHNTLLKPNYLELLHFFENQRDEQSEQIARDIKSSGIIDMYYGKWTEKYYNRRFLIHKDKDYCYTEHKCLDRDNRRMYFKHSMKKGFAEFYYKALVREQDRESPHCYLTRNIKNELHDNMGKGVVLDIGAAEGVFALDLTGFYKKCYLFEPDKQWIDALKKTFKHRQKDIRIVPKYVSETDDENTVSIDGFFGDNIPDDISIIKMDIEGFEISALNGMKKTLAKNPQAILLVCAYHKPNDEEQIKQMMEKIGYSVIHRDGYMFVWSAKDFAPPYKRRGVLEIRKRIDV